MDVAISTKGSFKRAELPWKVKRRSGTFDVYYFLQLRVHSEVKVDASVYCYKMVAVVMSCPL